MSSRMGMLRVFDSLAKLCKVGIWVSSRRQADNVFALIPERSAS